MTADRLSWAILIIALVTLASRAVPFLFFRQSRAIPPRIVYIGRYLPPAIITIILVYSFKSVKLTTPPYGLPELAAACAVIFLHTVKRNFLLSILGGTLLYIALAQTMGA
jgi:branched-subunit amino acid transport protein AzlD